MVESQTTLAARSISAAERSCSEKIEENFFADLAEFLWPKKTAFHLSEQTETSERMCRYWLAGSHKPTGQAVLALYAEIARRLK